jgi:ribosomal protein S18 acetylase RimI-like enzyme
MTPEIRLATIRHIDDLLPLVRAFHQVEEIAQDDESRRAAVAAMLMSPELGYIWLISFDGVVAGYIAVCLGYSIEFGGRDGFIDEFFLSAGFRGKGIGRKVLAMVLEQLREDEVKAVHLEVAQINHGVQELYKSAGFRLRDKYHLMSCILETGGIASMPTAVP